jgi:hypothetical protein
VGKWGGEDLDTGLKILQIRGIQVMRNGKMTPALTDGGRGIRKSNTGSNELPHSRSDANSPSELHVQIHPLASDDEVDPIRQRSEPRWDALPRLAAHDHGVGSGGRGVTGGDCLGGGVSVRNVRHDTRHSGTGHGAQVSGR